MQNGPKKQLKEVALKPVSAENLNAFSIDALRRAGAGEESARITAQVLVTTDTWGIHTHGTYHLPNYIKKIRLGGILPAARPVVISEGTSWALIDGQLALAMETSSMAMDLAIEKAAKAGTGFVGVRNSNHFGAAGYYANMAAARNMIGIAMSNGNPNMTVPGARGSVVGNNPFAYAVPCDGGRSVFMDIATSTVAASKVASAKFMAARIPDTWIVDEEGMPTTDVNKYPYSCSLQPMSGHKGYGLAVMIEILAGVLTGAPILNEIESWLLNLPDRTKIGHAFLAIDVDAINPILQFKERMNTFVREIHHAPKAKGQTRIFLPGEIEWEKREKALKSGIVLPEHVLANLFALANDEELDFMSLFVEKADTEKSG